MPSPAYQGFAARHLPWTPYELKSISQICKCNSVLQLQICVSATMIAVRESTQRVQTFAKFHFTSAEALALFTTWQHRVEETSTLTASTSKIPVSGFRLPQNLRNQSDSLNNLLAATLWWFTAAPKPLKIQVFGGHPAPRGRTAPIF